MLDDVTNFNKNESLPCIVLDIFMEVLNIGALNKFENTRIKMPVSCMLTAHYYWNVENVSKYYPMSKRSNIDQNTLQYYVPYLLRGVNF